MKKQFLLPLLSVAGGIAAFALYLLQNKLGFESATALPVPGHPAGLALVALLVISAILLFFLSRQLPAESAPSFPADFSTTDAGPLTLPIMGILLMGISGLLDAATILMPDVIPAEGTLTSQVRLIFAVTALLPAIALFPAAAACRVHAASETAAEDSEGPSGKKFSSSLLLIPPVCLVVRLVLAYRIHSINPSLEAYYVELLALVFLTLAFFRLASFAFQSGCTRRFALYTCGAVMLSFAVLASGSGLSSLLLYAGGGLTLLGFLILRLRE